MKRILCALLVVLIGAFGVACGKVGYTAIDIPVPYYEAFQNTTVEQIEWYLIASRQWDYSIETRSGTRSVRGTRHIPSDSSPNVGIYIYLHETPDLSDKINKTDYLVVDMSAANAAQRWDLRYYEQKPLVGVYDSNIVLHFSDAFSISIKETSADEDRALTRQALEEMGDLFLSMEEQREILQANNSVEILNGPWLQVGGELFKPHLISGYVRANGPNTARIKVVDQASGEVYYDQANKTSIFAVGWSDEPKEYFYYCQDLIIGRPADGPDEAYVDVQLWITEEGGEEYCAVSMKLRMEFWTW